MDYQIERLKHFLWKLPDRRGEQNLYFAKAESQMVEKWGDAVVWEPLAVLLGGGKDRIEAGRRSSRGCASSRWRSTSRTWRRRRSSAAT